MKLLVECAIEGTVELSEPVDIAAGEWEYHFVPDSNGMLRRIDLVSPIHHPERFTSTFKPPSGAALAEIRADMDHDLLDSIRRRLQALESHLAFRLHIRRIRWDSANYRLIFETQEERLAQHVYSIKVDYANAMLPNSRATRDLLAACGENRFLASSDQIS